MTLTNILALVVTLGTNRVDHPSGGYATNYVFNQHIILYKWEGRTLRATNRVPVREDYVKIVTSEVSFVPPGRVVVRPARSPLSIRDRTNRIAMPPLPTKP